VPKSSTARPTPAARKCGEPNGERVRIKRHGRSMPRQGAAGVAFVWSMIFSETGFHFSDHALAARWCDGRVAIPFRMAGGQTVRVDEATMPRSGRHSRTGLSCRAPAESSGPRTIRIGFPQDPEFTCVGRPLLDHKRNAETSRFLQFPRARRPRACHRAAGHSTTPWPALRTGMAAWSFRSRPPLCMRPVPSTSNWIDSRLEHAVCAGHGVPPPTGPLARHDRGRIRRRGSSHLS